MGKYSLDMEKYKSLARQAAAEGCVLLKNDQEALPLRKGDHVAVFGRMAFHYYKSGLGSGGLVNARYVVGILDALKERSEHGEIVVDEKLLSVYEDWIATHPYDEGEGWGKVPWSQEEMPLKKEIIDEAANNNDAAIVIIGRTAGEDQDNQALPGQYLLTDVEEAMICDVSKAFTRTIVVLNVGNIIDMKWVEKYNTAAVLYAWQGGQEGGNGVCDILLGDRSPSGKLTDTIAYDISDYASTENFGDEKKNFYKEDIYVGYRYFETFARERVLYPFGYGLSYTRFSLSDIKVDFTVNKSKANRDEPESNAVHADAARTSAEAIGEANRRLAEKAIFAEITITVQNTGKFTGAEVVQVYAQAPQGKLGKPTRVLAGFARTKELKPDESETIAIRVREKDIASFDDSGVTGHRNCFVLEEGRYQFYVGTDVRSAKSAGEYALPEIVVVEKLEEACAPREAFQRMRPVSETVQSTGETTSVNQSLLQNEERQMQYAVSYEDVPLRTFGVYDRVERPNPLPLTGDKGYRLADVCDGTVSMDEFVSQLTVEELMQLFRGEGMCSPKVTPGTGSAFGGLTEGLRHYGIPAACTTDGPSGLRLDIGTKAFSLPNGACIGCSFDEKLTEELYGMLGRELRQNRIDALLGPGLNIHRNPLNGRNFEYISEDPYLTGKIGAAILRGLNVVGSTGTIKHFAGNNQEKKRRSAEGIISARAMREIYLKGFEMTVKEGDARAVMTTYGPVNGIWTAGNYELNTMILRDEWGYDGIVMTDWWAEGNYENQAPSMECRAPMVAAGNDLYMCSSDATDNTQDDLQEAYEDGRITLGQLQRNANHILRFILKSPAMLYEMNKISEEELSERRAASSDTIDPNSLVYFEADSDGTVVIPNQNWNAVQGENVLFGINNILEGHDYRIVVRAESSVDELAQLPVSIFCDNILKETISFRGSNGAEVIEERKIGGFFGKTHYIRLYMGATGLHIKEIRFESVGEREDKTSFFA